MKSNNSEPNFYSLYSKRDEELASMRPKIPKAKIKKGISNVEEFQNLTLRPIIKLQHQIIIDSFKLHIKQFGKVYCNKTNEERVTFISDSLSKNIGFKNYIRGIVVAHFTREEFQIYGPISKEVDRRIVGIVKQRLLDSMEEINN